MLPDPLRHCIPTALLLRCPLHEGPMVGSFRAVQAHCACGLLALLSIVELASLTVELVLSIQLRPFSQSTALGCPKLADQRQLSNETTFNGPRIIDIVVHQASASSIALQIGIVATLTVVITITALVCSSSFCYLAEGGGPGNKRGGQGPGGQLQRIGSGFAAMLRP